MVAVVDTAAVVDTVAVYMGAAVLYIHIIIQLRIVVLRIRGHMITQIIIIHIHMRHVHAPSLKLRRIVQSVEQGTIVYNKKVIC